MIMMLVKYYCKENQAEAFLDAIKENNIDFLSRKEVGNRMYDYSFPADEQDTILLTELWEDTEAVSIHSTTEHFKRLGEIKEQYVDRTEIKKFAGTPL